jgi:hypothetical protein
MVTRVLLALALVSAGCVVSGDVLSSGDDEPGDDGGGGGPDGGAPAACGAPPSCAAGTLCGRLHDVATSRGLTEADDAPLPTIRLVDLDGLVELGDPVGADECGDYVLPVDTLIGDLAVIAEPAPGDDRFVATATRLAAPTDRRADAFALARDTDRSWADAIGAGDTAVGSGAMLLVFVDMLGADVAPLPGAPVADVAVTIDGLGNGDVHYFADEAATDRAEPSAALTATAASGAALVRPVQPLAAYGGLAATCGFAPALGADLDGMLQVVALVGACANP